MQQRLFIAILTLLATMTAMADGTEPKFVASPDYGGTIAFASDQNHNSLVVTPSQYFYIEKVTHEYEEGGSTGFLTLTPDPMTGYYYVNSSYGGTVTAYFKKTDVNVSFDMAGHPNAANAPGNIDLAIDETVTRPAPDPTDGGYIFLGWYLDAACTTPFNFYTQLYNILNYNTNKHHYDLTIYALWAKENCTVTFNANGGSGTMAAVTKAGGTEFIPSCGFSRDDYFFIGWATSAGGEVVYHPEDKITLTDDLTLYARWAKENCTVTFAANGGTGTMDAVTQAGGTEFEIPSCGFSYDGDHPYAGWATSADGEVVYHPEDKITLTDDLTLYAKWSYPQTQFSLNGLIYKTNNETSPTLSLIKYYIDKPTGELEIPGSVTYGGTEYTVTTIENSAFRDCTGLTSVTIGDGVTTIGTYAFLGCTGLTSFTIPDGVTTIENRAFRDCTGLTSVTIGDGVTTIGNSAFLGCTGLTSVTIPDGVTTIGTGAFKGCTGLTSVTIGDGVTTIGNSAFLGCTGLTSVTIFAPSLTKYESLAFSGNAEGRKIYVPSGSVDIYKAGWSGYVSASDIEPLDYIIDEGDDVSILSDGTGKNVALKRSFAKGKKQTVCLPYAPAELLNYGKVWQFTGISDGKAVMTEITDAALLQANTPYIFEATNDLLNITFPSVAISIGSDPKTEEGTAGFTFHGTYKEKTWEADAPEVTGGTIYGFMMKDNDGQQVGQFVKARRRTVLRPFSCYLEYDGSLTGTASAARGTTRGEAQEALPDVIEIVWQTADTPGATTDIGELRIKNLELRDNQQDVWFDLSGRRLNGKPTAKGVYIHNGRKEIIN